MDYPTEIENAIERESLALYKTVVGSGSNFRAGVDFIIRYLRAHPEARSTLIGKIPEPVEKNETE